MLEIADLKAWAEERGWKVWASDKMWELDHPEALYDYDPIRDKYVNVFRLYVLKNPYGVIYVGGQPAVGTPNPDGTTSYKVPIRKSEVDAWADLPKTRDEIWKHSGPPVRRKC